jgi:hypothetical protein
MADLSEKLKREKKKVKKIAEREITIDKILKDFLEDRIRNREMNEIQTRETEVGTKLSEILAITGSFIKVKKYAQYLQESKIKHSTANLAKFLEENQEKEITHRRKEKKVHEEGQSEAEETEEEDVDVESEVESEEEEEEETEEERQEKREKDRPKFTMEEKEVAKMLNARIQKERDLEIQRIERATASAKKKSPRVEYEKQKTREVKVLKEQAGDVVEYIAPSSNLPYFEMSDRQLIACSSEYRNAVWLNTSEKRVVAVYCNDHRFGVKGRQIEYMQQEWYPVNRNYFTVQCTTPRELKTQRGDMMIFNSNSDKKTDEIKFAILYAFNNGTLLLQDEEVFNAEQMHFREKYANTEQRKDLLLSGSFCMQESVIARTLGRRRFEDIPDGDRIEGEIADMVCRTHNTTVENYFEEIANISAYLKDNSVFKQRLQMGYYSGMNISRLSDYDKFDYPELHDYYRNAYSHELYSLGWGLFDLTYKGSKHFNKPDFSVMTRPEIQDENLDGRMVFYDGNVLSIDSLLEQDVRGSREFIDKIRKMHHPQPAKVVEKHVKPIMPDIFQVLEEKLRKLKEVVLPTLPKSAELDEFIRLYGN